MIVLSLLGLVLNCELVIQIVKTKNVLFQTLTITSHRKHHHVCFLRSSRQLTPLQSTLENVFKKIKNNEFVVKKLIQFTRACILSKFLIT